MARPPFPRPQHYAVAQEQLRHDDAVHWFGEMTAWITWWKLADFEAGLVQRCPRCWNASGELAQIADAYGQATQHECVECYGTTFENGVKAVLYAPAMWDTAEISEDVGKRGEEHLASASIQSVSALHVRDNDTAVRVDNSRWRVAQPRLSELATGFGFHRLASEMMRSTMQANLQPPRTVDYLVAVDLARLDTAVSAPEITDGNILVPQTAGRESEGWILFEDTARTLLTPMAVPAATWTVLPNNRAVVSNNGAPTSATTWWNGSTNRFMPPTINDLFSLQLSFEATSPVAARELEIELVMGTTVLYHGLSVLTVAGVPEHINVTATVLVDNTLITTGAQWRIRCTGSATVHGIQLIARREYRA